VTCDCGKDDCRCRKENEKQKDRGKQKGKKCKKGKAAQNGQQTVDGAEVVPTSAQMMPSQGMDASGAGGSGANRDSA